MLCAPGCNRAGALLELEGRCRGRQQGGRQGWGAGMGVVSIREADAGHTWGGAGGWQVVGGTGGREQGVVGAKGN